MTILSSDATQGCSHTSAKPVLPHPHWNFNAGQHHPDGCYRSPSHADKLACALHALGSWASHGSPGMHGASVLCHMVCWVECVQLHGLQMPVGTQTDCT